MMRPTESRLSRFTSVGLMRTPAVSSMNWTRSVTENESRITLRPKIRETVQFPVPLNNSVQALYGVGLLLPELLLIAGGIVWLRRRSA